MARTVGRCALVLSLVCERGLVDDKRTGVVLDSHPHPPGAEYFKAVLVPHNFRCRYSVEMNYELRLQYNIARGVISGFRRDVAEHCALPGCYAASSDIFIFLTPEDGTGRLSRNVGKNSLLLAA